MRFLLSLIAAGLLAIASPALAADWKTYRLDNVRLQVELPGEPERSEAPKESGRTSYRFQVNGDPEVVLVMAMTLGDNFPSDDPAAVYDIIIKSVTGDEYRLISRRPVTVQGQEGVEILVESEGELIRDVMVLSGGLFYQFIFTVPANDKNPAWATRVVDSVRFLEPAAD